MEVIWRVNPNPEQPALVVHAVNSVTLSRHTSGVGQARERRTGGANSSERNTDHGACVAALRESLCRRDSALRLLAREPPLPAIRALIRAGTGTLRVTELTAWTTRWIPSSGYPGWAARPRFG